MSDSEEKRSQKDQSLKGGVDERGELDDGELRKLCGIECDADRMDSTV